MGLFDFISSATAQLGSDIAGGLNLLSSIGSHPIDTLESVGSFIINPTKQNAQSVVNQVNKTKSEGAVKTITNTVVNTAIASAALASGSYALGGTGIVGTTGKIITQTVTSHPIASTAALIATPIVTNVLTSSPKAAVTFAKAVSNAPSSLQNYGSNIGNAIENPSLSSISKIVTDNPILTAATVAGAAYLGSGLVSTVTTALNTEASRANTAASKANTAASQQSLNIPTAIIPQSPPENVLTPSANIISKAAPSKKKKKKVTTKKSKTKKKSIKRKKVNKNRKVSKKKKKKR